MNTTLVELDDKSCLVTDEKGNFSISSSDRKGKEIVILQLENDLETLKNNYKKINNKFFKQLEIFSFNIGLTIIFFFLPTLTTGSFSILSLSISTLFSIIINTCVNKLTNFEIINIKNMMDELNKLEIEIPKATEKLEQFKIKYNYKKVKIVEKQNTEDQNGISEIYDYSARQKIVVKKFIANQKLYN